MNDIEEKRTRIKSLLLQHAELSSNNQSKKLQFGNRMSLDSNSKNAEGEEWSTS